MTAGPWIPRRTSIGGFAVYAALLVLSLSQSLARLVALACRTDLHSHALLVPVVTSYLFLTRRRSLPVPEGRSIVEAAVLGVIGVATLAGKIAGHGSLSLNDDLTLTTFSFLSLLAAGGFFLMGARWMRAAAFPFAFLLFLIPLPDALVAWLESALAAASTEAAAVLFGVAGTPVVRHGSVFELPGIALQVGRECSGIRSSWVLFITSVLAANMFLKSPWRRIALVAFVIPLGILRNGFRIFVIGLLCEHVGPEMIDSPLHHRGGPLFFALSLVPLALLLWWLRRGERRPSRLEATAGVSQV